MRQGSSATAALNRLRSRIEVNQSYVNNRSEVALHLSFRDENPSKTPGVTNALADILTTYIAPVDSSAGTLRSDTSADQPPSVASSNPELPLTTPPAATASTTLAQVAPPASGSNLSGLSKDQLRRKMNWVDGQLADLATEQSTVHAASLTVQGRISQVQASGHDQAASRESSRPAADPSADTRAQLTQQLAVEQKKLSALRERYTDAYPDVQNSQAHVAQLQAKLADLPAVPREPVVNTREPDLYQKNVDQLTAEESQLGGKLRDIEHQIAGLEHRREQIRIAILTAPETAAPAQQPPVPAVKPPPPPTATPRTPAIRRSVKPFAPPAGDLESLVVRPFHILAAATTSTPVQRLSPIVFGIAGGAWAAFMLICLVPLLWMKSAVITTEDDLRATLPRQVAYLGSVRRIVQ